MSACAPAASTRARSAQGGCSRRLVAECFGLALALFDEQLELGELHQTLGACARQPNAAAKDRRAADAPETRRRLIAAPP